MTPRHAPGCPPCLPRPAQWEGGLRNDPEDSLPEGHMGPNPGRPQVLGWHATCRGYAAIGGKRTQWRSPGRHLLPVASLPIPPRTAKSEADFRPSLEGETMRRGLVAWRRSFWPDPGVRPSAGICSLAAPPDARPYRRRFLGRHQAVSLKTLLGFGARWLPSRYRPWASPTLASTRLGAFSPPSRLWQFLGSPFSPLLTYPSARPAQPYLLPGPP